MGTPSNFKDLTGQRFGKLVVIKRAESRPKKNGKTQTMWHCKCDCGNETDVFTGNLTRGLTKSCGCSHKNRHPKNFVDLSGQRFGRLVVREIAETKNWNVYWKCQCDCGNTKNILAAKLRSGRTKSCGCLTRETTTERNTTHGLRHKRIYSIYCTMKARCYNPNNDEYHNYGGRGIIVCPEWLGKNGVENFAKWSYENGYDENAEYGQCTIDRIDVNGNYEPSNCRWATQKQQMRNTRYTIFLTYKGETKSAAEWSEITGIKQSLLTERKRKGWSDEDCIERPVRKTKRSKN